MLHMAGQMRRPGLELRRPAALESPLNCRQFCASAPLLFGRYGSIHFAYQLVRGPIQSASWMKLITDGTVGPKGKHTEDFVF